MRIPFVNRNEEIEYLLKLASQGVRIPLFIYGPEGCGKTRLLEELNSILRSKNFVSLYIDAKEYSIEQAIRGSSREFVDLLLDIASDITEPFGKVFIKLISKIINEYERRYRFKGKKLVLLVDEVVEGIGFENIERYTKILYDLA
ncbi:MAG TPA: hypothetical protein ENF93_02210, partial [Ignisphaera sp.]|nr:hypothetical protein [Ignisphaera sp.]